MLLVCSSASKTCRWQMEESWFHFYRRSIVNLLFIFGRILWYSSWVLICQISSFFCSETNWQYTDMGTWTIDLSWLDMFSLWESRINQYLTSIIPYLITLALTFIRSYLTTVWTILLYYGLQTKLRNSQVYSVIIHRPIYQHDYKVSVASFSSTSPKGLVYKDLFL